jgi:hypothetical protein
MKGIAGFALTKFTRPAYFMNRVRPHLHFFTELDGADLAGLFTPEVIAALRQLKAGVTMGLRDLSAERAASIRALNDAQVPVGAWVLVDRADGYFAHAGNAPVIAVRCAEVLAFAADQGLTFEALGLDFEPPLHELEALLRAPLPTLRKWKVLSADRPRLAQATAQYTQLINDLQARGVRVESYQFPTVLDDRKNGQTFWQRFAGAMNVPVDREVMMLYSSLFGRAVFDSFGPGARAIAIGSTGGGVDPLPKLDWPSFVEDLRAAAHWCDDVSIFSLEGCVAQGYLPRLVEFDWQLAPAPRASGRHVVSFARWLIGVVTS